jgi:hypothetical protein
MSSNGEEAPRSICCTTDSPKCRIDKQKLRDHLMHNRFRCHNLLRSRFPMSTWRRSSEVICCTTGWFHCHMEKKLRDLCHMEENGQSYRLHCRFPCDTVKKLRDISVAQQISMSHGEEAQRSSVAQQVGSENTQSYLLHCRFPCHMDKNLRDISVAQQISMSHGQETRRSSATWKRKPKAICCTTDSICHRGQETLKDVCCTTDSHIDKKL